MLTRRRLGRTGQEVSILALGGNGLMRTHGNSAEAVRIVHRALDLGINYFDAARVYDGCESYLGEALVGRRDQVFLASKSAGRSRAAAMRDLEVSLRALRTPYLDLWEVHDLRTREELDEITSHGGALEAFETARRDGKVRYIGITAHHDPEVLRQALSLFSYDTCMLPVNIAEPHFRSFMQLIPLCAERATAVIAMKALCGGLLGSPDPLLRFALSQSGVCTAAVGVQDVEQLEENVSAVDPYRPMSESEMEQLVAAAAPHAMRLQYYKKRPPARVFSLN